MDYRNAFDMTGSVAVLPDATDPTVFTKAADPIVGNKAGSTSLSMTPASARPNSAVETPDDEWRAVTDFDINGMFWCFRAFRTPHDRAAQRQHHRSRLKCGRKLSHRRSALAPTLDARQEQLCLWRNLNGALRPSGLFSPSSKPQDAGRILLIPAWPCDSRRCALRGRRRWAERSRGTCRDRRPRRQPGWHQRNYPSNRHGVRSRHPNHRLRT
jgi:hypothetical protein